MVFIPIMFVLGNRSAPQRGSKRVKKEQFHIKHKIINRRHDRVLKEAILPFHPTHRSIVGDVTSVVLSS
jgi:hypothetical protein